MMFFLHLGLLVRLFFVYDFGYLWYYLMFGVMFLFMTCHIFGLAEIGLLGA